MGGGVVGMVWSLMVEEHSIAWQGGLGVWGIDGIVRLKGPCSTCNYQSRI